MKTLIAALAATAVHLTPMTPPALVWVPCDNGMECAAIRVPLNWQRPGGREVVVALGRLKAAGPSQGTVLVNYGGPGAPGIEVMGSNVLSPGFQPFAQLRQHMDIVTWDPRGFGLGGKSTPSMDWACLSSVPQHGMPALPTTQAEFDQLVVTSRAAADACRIQDPALFDHMDAIANAQDMEAIRRALGVPQLNLYMGSYGGVYGQTYADLYPGRVRTMVIDGSGDHSGDFERSQDALARDNVERRHRFADWCATDATCALHGQDVTEVATAALSDWGSKLTLSGRLIHSDRTDFPQLAIDLDKAAHGDKSVFVAPGMGYPVSECHEWPAPRSFTEVQATAARLQRIDPVLGAAGTMLPFTLACTGWPGGLDNPPQPLPQGLPPLLGVGTWGDFPATDRVISRVPGSASIYHDGAGHELYATGSACVIPLVDQYFLTARPQEARC